MPLVFDDEQSPAPSPASGGGRLVFDDEAPKVNKPRSAADFIRDTGASFLQGAVDVNRAISNVGGADNIVSEKLGELSSGIDKNVRTEAGRARRQEHQRLLEEAANRGMGAEAWQAVKNFTDGPESVADYAAQGLGSVAGLYPAMKTAGITAVRAGLGALGARIATGAAVGVPVGVGATKGSQYEESLQYLQGQGVPEARAKEMAAQAQAYGKDNALQHAIGGGLGVVDVLTGGEAAMLGKNAIAGRIKNMAKRGAEEFGTEMVQGGHEKFAGNLAAIDVGDESRNSMRGVVGAGVQGGLMGMVAGAGSGAFEQAKQTAAQDQTPLPATETGITEPMPDAMPAQELVADEPQPTATNTTGVENGATDQGGQVSPVAAQGVESAGSDVLGSGTDTQAGLLGGLAGGSGSAGSMAIPAGVDSVAGDEGVQGLTADTAMWLGAGDVAGYLQGKTASEKDALLAEIRSRDASHADEIQSLLPSQTPDTAPTPKTDGSSEIVGANGMRIVHGSGNANLTADDIQIVRQGQKQGKKGRSYGGLYGASETDLAQAEEYAAMMGGSPTVYDITIQPGTRVLHKEGDITRLSENYINDLVAQGYGLVTGRDMRGRNEYVVIDRNAVATMQPRSTPINQAVPASLPVDSAADALMTPKQITALDRVTEIDGRLKDEARPEQRAELAKERESITASWPKAITGHPTSFSTEAGVRLDAQYALMDAGELTTSHDENLRPTPTYPPELQPRQRDRAASEMQIAGIVQRLDPARLGESADAANGAPIVGADGLVESGNGRTIALKRIYQAKGQRADEYKQFLKENAQRFGLAPEQIDGMAAPVLVRVRTTPVNRAEFARQANAATVAQMSPSEQAKSDAARIDSLEGLNPDDNGDFMTGTSRDFVRGFMARIPGTEQSGMIDAAGNLSQTGYTRLRNAVLAKAYGDSPVLLRMVESLDDNIRNLSKSLIQAAPTVAKARQSIQEGLLFDSDITPDLLAAVEELSRLKDEGKSVHDALAQAGMFGEQYSPETRELLQFLADNIRRPRKIAEFIQTYFDGLNAAGNPNQGSLLGDTAAPAKGDLMNAARRNQDGTEGISQDRQTGQQGGKQREDAPGDQKGAEGNQEDTGPAEGAAAVAVDAPAVAKTDEVDFRKPRYRNINDAEKAIKKFGLKKVGVFKDGDQFKIDTKPGAKSEDFSLTSETPEQVKAKEEAQAAKAKADQEAADKVEAEAKAKRIAAEVDGRQEASAENFVLGQNAEDALAGQGDLLSAPINEKRTDSKPAESAQSKPKRAPRTKKAESSNTVFTEDAAAAARAVLKKKLGQLNTGIDPEIMQAGITLAGYHIEKGARTFAAYAKAMLEDLGDAVKPYLKSWYAAVSLDPRATGFNGMDDLATVQTADLDAILKETGDTNEPDQRSSTDLERNRQDARTQDGMGEEVVRNDSGSDGGTGKQGILQPDKEGSGKRSERVPGRETVASGTQGDLSPFADAAGTEDGIAGSGLDQRSSDLGFDGQTIEPAGTEATDSTAQGGIGLSEKRQAQVKAQAVKVVPGNRANIAESLPFLLEGQKDDVAFAENRFSKPNGYGVLFTNGTGTGKTFSGLGVIKRFERQGKSNILIVVPSDKISSDWVNAGRELKLDITGLADTQDAGKGIVITTYANMGANNALVNRKWDLIVADESHYMMQAKDGGSTNALDNLRAITMHPRGQFERHSRLHAKEIARLKQLSGKITSNNMIMNLDDTMDQMRYALQDENAKMQAEADKLTVFLREKQEQVKVEVEAAQGIDRTRAVFLSATPFAYEKTVDYAEGYLFNYAPEDTRGGYNSGSPFDRFMMQHFGYRMRYNKLNEPGPEVNRGVMQRAFNSWLKSEKVLSGRMLDVEHDYDRKFILVDSAIGAELDRAMQWIWDRAYDQANQNKEGYSMLQSSLAEKFDHLARRYLLEAIKAKEAIPIIRAHLDMGRKVVVFHDFKKGGGFNPLRFGKGAGTTDDAKAYNAAIDAFNAEFADLIESPMWGAESPIDALSAAFQDALLFNGDVPAKKRRENATLFNDDNSGKNLIIGQSAAMKEGVSLHDTTGKHQRVLINLGLPTQPTTAIQQEGRIFRVGQASNAIFRYLNTGTNWERFAFATSVAQRASAAENLAVGEEARALMDAFIEGFEESDTYAPGHEGEGTGGKARDKAANQALTEWDRAMTLYWAQQKKNSRTKAQEGVDYFATPEPLGLKMVEWADIRDGDKALEPSAGHGAIARWFPDNIARTVVEPSSELASRLKMVVGDARLLQEQFEQLDTAANKYDAVVMNPPFGSGGKTAVDHVSKAAKHLNNGGRIVALIPTGPAADKKFDKWFYEEEQKAVKPLIDHPTLGPIYKGDTVKTNASWMPEGKVIRRDAGGNIYLKNGPSETTVNQAAWTEVVSSGPRTESFRPAADLYLRADIKLPQVTFERAGTRVAARVVVIEKQTDKDAAAKIQQVNRDYSDSDDIKEFFSRIKESSIPARAMPATSPAAAPEPAVSGKTKPAADGKKLETDAEEITYTTKKGKVLNGVIAKGITEAQAKEYDLYTWKKDGGFFIRMEHVKRPGEAPKFSRNIGAGIPKPAAQSIADRIAAANKNMPKVRVFASPADLDRNIQTQAALYAEIESAGALNDVEGAAHDGEIYLFSDNLADEARAEHVLAIHEVTHHGLRKVFGAELNPILQSIWANNANVRKQASALGERLGLKSNTAAVEEVLADMKPADLVKLNGWRKLAQFMRDWFQNHGFTSLAGKLDGMLKAGMNEQQQADMLVADVVNAARDWVKGGKQAGKVASGTMLQRVWHGTPHVWNPEPGFPHGRPRLDKMGTGEGAQAYGWGWYSAEEIDVAQSYQDMAKRDLINYAGPDRAKWAAGQLASRLKYEDIVDGLELLGVEASKTDQVMRDALAMLRDLGSLYQLDIPDTTLPYLLDWDKPLSEQTPEVKKALESVPQYAEANDRARRVYTAESLYKRIADNLIQEAHKGNDGKYQPLPASFNEFKAASEYLASLGIVGNRYLDGQSRNRPLKDIKREFLAELPEDADFDEVSELIGTGHFSPKNDALLKALRDDEWLGFDYPAQAISAALSKDLGNYDASPALLRAVSDAQEGATFNFVIWDQPTLDKIAMLERNGEKLDAMRESETGGKLSRMTEDRGPGADLTNQPTRPGSEESINAAAMEIAAAIEADNDQTADYGLRVIPGEYEGKIEIGDTLPPSKQWNDGEPIDEDLSGTSAAEIKGGDVDSVLKAIKYIGAHGKPGPNGFYFGNRIVLIKGGRNGTGEDVGEVLIEDAEVVGMWKKPTKGNSAISPNNDPSFSRSGQSSGRTKLSRASQSNLPGVSQSPTVQPPSQQSANLQGGSAGNQSVFNTPEPSKMDDIIFKLQDKHIDLKRAIQGITDAGRQIADKWNTYMQEELFHGRSAKRVKDFTDRELAPMLREMALRKVSIADLDKFLWARHAKEANALIEQRDPGVMVDDVTGKPKGSGMTDQEADDYFASLSQDQRNQLDAIAKKVDDMLVKTRELYVSYGLEGRDTVQGWADMFQHYVPLMREDHDGGMGIGQGFSIKGRETKHRTGSTRAVADVLANIATQRERAIVRGEKNRVAVSLAGLVKLNPAPDFWTLDKIPQERVLNEKTGQVETREVPNYRTRDNVIIAKIKDSNGNVKERAIVLNENDERAVRLAKSMKNIDIPMLEGWLGSAAAVTRYFSAINTQYNPVFGAINLIRDVGAGALNLSSTALKGKERIVTNPKRIASAVAGIYSDARKERKGQAGTSAWSQLWEDFTEQGGQTGYRDMFKTSNDRADAMQMVMDPTSWTESKWGKFFTANGALKVPLLTVQKAATPLFDWLSDYNLAMENAVRLSAYKEAIDSGMTKPQAASLAKNLTVNFNRKGAYGAQAGALYAFFNAATQGSARIGETLTRRDHVTGKYSVSDIGKKIIGGGIMLGAMQAFSLAMAGFDDDEPPEFIRERNIVVPLPGGKYLAIPMPLGFHVIPNIGRITAETVMGRRGSAVEAVIDLAGITFEAFNPIGSAGWSMQTVAPTVLDPMAALIENKDWTGKPIAKEKFSDSDPTPGFDMARDNASAIATGIAYAINLATGGSDYTAGRISPTPDQLDYLWGQVTGGVGREFNKLYQTVESPFTGEELPPYKIPLAGRLYGDTQSKSAVSSRYYENIRDMKRHKAEYLGRRENGDAEGAREYLADNPEAKLFRAVGAYESKIQQLRSAKRKAVERGINPDRVKAIEQRTSELMDKFNQQVESAQQ